MIKLQTLTQEQRQAMLQNMEYFSHIMWKKTGFLRPTHTLLVNQFGEEYTQELWVLLTYASRAVRYNTKGFRLSLDKNNYIAANKQYSTAGHKVSQERMRELLELMDAAGYITLLLGFNNGVDSALTAVVLKSITQLIDKTKADKLAPARDVTYWIEVVDTEKSNTTKKYSKGNVSKRKDFVFKSTQNIRGIKEHRDFLSAWYKQINSSIITIDGEVDNAITIKQRFEDTLDLCGRYYLGGFQTRKSHLRQTITINGEEVCEVDYKNCQPRMLAAMNNVDLPDDFDAYAIEGLDRTFAKSLLFPVLFSCSRKDAKTSVTGKLKEAGITHMNSEDVLKAFEEHNSYMKESFYTKKLYQVLQNNDSRMVKYIVEHFLNKNVTVLAYHDSIVAPAQYCKELQRVMKEAWTFVMGTSASCKPSVEFSNKQPIQSTEVTGHLDTIVPLSMYQEYDYTVANITPVEDCTRRHPPVPMPSYQEEELASQTHCYSDYMDSIEELLEGEGLPF